MLWPVTAKLSNQPIASSRDNFIPHSQTSQLQAQEMMSAQAMEPANQSQEMMLSKNAMHVLYKGLHNLSKVGKQGSTLWELVYKKYARAYT